MVRMVHRMGAAIAVLVLGAGVPASAQENFDEGKTPAQLYASDCAICHKSPRGLSRAAGMFGLINFLREHYTVSRENAASIAAYLQQLDREPTPASPRSATRKRSAPKLPPARPTAGAPSETGPAEANPADAKPVEAGGQAQAKAGAKAAASPKASEPGKKTD